MDRRRMFRGAAAVGWALGLACIANVALAGTTGKLSGHVTNQKHEPLIGVNVIVVGMPLGGATDETGRYAILNIPSGRISVKASMIGHTPVTVQNVEISADNTTKQDFELSEAAVAMQEVVVSARRPVIEVNRTSNIATVSRQQLQTLPVQELQDVVNLQAGVVDGHFRGGREGEVQYQVDGVSVNNAYDNKSSLKLDRSLLEEVQVISGTFDAEYGQAMSGVVNAVLKRGTEKFQWDGEIFTGGPLFSSSAGRIVDSTPRPFSQQNYQFSVNGPSRVPRTTYLLSLRHYVNDDWIRGERRFVPGDSSNFSAAVPHPTGDDQKVALGYSHEYSGVVKLTNHTLKHVEVSYQAIVNVADTRQSNWAFHVDPDGLKKQHQLSVTEGMDLTHTLSATRFYTLSVRQNYTNYRDMVFRNVFDPRYDDYGKPQSLSQNYEHGAYVQGVDLDRFVQTTNGAIVKGSLIDQSDKDHQLKIGGEFQAPHVRFGAPGYLQFYSDSTSGGVETVHRITDYQPKFPGVQEYRPLIGAAFAQEEVEWNDLTLRGGVRFEYFSARSSLPSDLANPANSISGVPQSHPQATTPKISVAPRLGVSYPISKTASLFFAYGHFYQFPGLGDLLRNSDYNQLADLQASSSSLPILGNPDIRPERTIQYQFGYKQALSEFLGLDVTAFYKDIRDLLGTEIIETYNGAQYARLANVDFGNVIGVTVTLNQRTKGIFSSTLDYTWQSAQGNSSDPNETANRAAAGEDARPRSLPFNWDQRHTLNLTLMLTKPEKFSASAIVKAASGQPYTPAIESGFGNGLETNSGRKPATLVVDLRGDHRLNTFGHGSRVFARVFNAFDTRFNNGFVFATSGDPYYSRFPIADQAALADPTRFQGPRRVEVGLTLNVSN